MEGHTISDNEVEERKFLVALVPVVHDRSSESQSKHGSICAVQSEMGQRMGFTEEASSFTKPKLRYPSERKSPVESR
jgi:hypothetical protein